MHEAGVVRDVLRKAGEVALDEGSDLTSVRVRIGALSGIDPESFRDQFALVAPGVALAIEIDDGQEVGLVSLRIR